MLDSQLLVGDEHMSLVDNDSVEKDLKDGLWWSRNVEQSEVLIVSLGKHWSNDWNVPSTYLSLSPSVWRTFSFFSGFGELWLELCKKVEYDQ